MGFGGCVKGIKVRSQRLSSQSFLVRILCKAAIEKKEEECKQKRKMVPRTSRDQESVRH